MNKNVLPGWQAEIFSSGALTTSMHQVLLPDGTNARFLSTYHADVPLAPFIYNGGFNESFATLSTGVDLSQRYGAHGFNSVMIEPRQHDMQPLPGWKLPDTITSQARHSQDVVEAIGLQDNQLPLVGYSAGGQRVAAMVYEAAARGHTCYQEAPLVLLAATGVHADESPIKFFERGFRMALQDMFKPDYLPVPPTTRVLGEPQRNDVMSLGVDILKRPFHSVWQYLEMTSRPIDLTLLSQFTGALAVIAFQKDHILPHKVLEPALVAVFEQADTADTAGVVSYHVPYSAEDDLEGHRIGHRNSTHLDPFICPDRVVNCVVSVMRDY